MMRFSTFLRTAYTRGYTLFLLPLACLPALALPFVLVPIEMQKGMIAALLLGGVVFFFGLSLLLGRTTFKARNNIAVSFLLLFLLHIVVSGWMNTSSAWQLFGLSFEIGTVGSFFLFGIAFFAGSTGTLRGLKTGIYLWLAASAFAGCAALVSYMFGGPENFTTLAGAWPQLSLVLASALLASIVLFESIQERRPLFFFATLFFAALFACFFHSAAAIALLVALIAFIAHFLYERRRIPLCASITAVAIVILLLTGMRTPFLQMPPDIRLSFFLNEIILAPAYISDIPQALFGVGPGNFSTLWEINRPYEFNQTPLWDRAFTQGYSTVGTFLGEIGFVGMLLLFLIPCSFIISFFSRIRGHAEEEREGDATYIALVFLAIFSLIAFAIYTIHIALFLGGAFALGAWVRRFSSGDINLSLPIQKMGRIFGGSTAIVLGVLLVWIASLQFLAAQEYVQGLDASEKRQFANAAKHFKDAAAMWPAPLYQRDASRALLENAASSFLLESAEFKTLAAEAVTHADNAALYGPKDYWNWISKASIYVSLYSFGFAELEEETGVALEQAHSLSPSRPEPLYLMSVFEFARGNKGESIKYIEEALALKPDYQEALAFQARMRDTTSQ